MEVLKAILSDESYGYLRINKKHRKLGGVKMSVDITILKQTLMREQVFLEKEKNKIDKIWREKVIQAAIYIEILSGVKWNNGLCPLLHVSIGEQGQRWTPISLQNPSVENGFVFCYSMLSRVFNQLNKFACESR